MTAREHVYSSFFCTSQTRMATILSFCICEAQTRMLKLYLLYLYITNENGHTSIVLYLCITNKDGYTSTGQSRSSLLIARIERCVPFQPSMQSLNVAVFLKATFTGLSLAPLQFNFPKRPDPVMVSREGTNKVKSKRKECSKIECTCMSRRSLQRTVRANCTLLAALFLIPSLLHFAGADRRGGPGLYTAGLCATQQGQPGTKCYGSGEVEKADVR
jgi:hypothetical protein